jgi:outer membrane protein OmpA-like peptidoglycan-associated protein
VLSVPHDKATALTLEQDRREVQKTIDDANIKYQGTKLKLDTVFASAKRIVPFSFSTAALGGQAKAMVGDMLPFARQAERIYVRGRTDATGTAAMNRALAVSRAISVRAGLVAGGIPEYRVRTTYCTTCYLASNATEEGRRINRRVEIEMVMPAPLAAKFADPDYKEPATVLAIQSQPPPL